MTGTVIRVFEKFADAQDARSALLKSGFPEESVVLTSREDETAPMDTDFRLPAEDSGKGLRGMLHSLTGGKEERERHSVNASAVRRGSLQLTVEAEDDRLGQAAEILDRFNAIDVDRRTSH